LLIISRIHIETFSKHCQEEAYWHLVEIAQSAAA
jgi:hypothetical protein